MKFKLNRNQLSNTIKLQMQMAQNKFRTYAYKCKINRKTEEIVSLFIQGR